MNKYSNLLLELYCDCVYKVQRTGLIGLYNIITQTLNRLYNGLKLLVLKADFDNF